MAGLWWHFATVYVLGKDETALFQPGFFSRRTVNGSYHGKPLGEARTSRDTPPNTLPLSHIAQIRCENFAGVSGINGDCLELNLATRDRPFSNLVVVTGETGHGKVSKNNISASALFWEDTGRVVLTHDLPFISHS